MKGPQRNLKIELLYDRDMHPDRECNGGEYCTYIKKVPMKSYLNYLNTKIKF